MESMKYIHRHLEGFIQKTLGRHKSVMLLGPRQTGKSTLIGRLRADLTISFIQPHVRQRYEKNFGLLTGEVQALAAKNKKPLIVLDEIQKIPEVMDVLQDLIDRNVADFVITGSSARKLRRGSSINLLPGRCVALRLDPLSMLEYPQIKLEDALIYGSLPGIILNPNKDEREVDLNSYTVVYLEEEVRAEALVRNVGTFARFLELASLESGRIINFRKLSQEIGVAHTTIASYFEILQDCLIVERVGPLIKSRSRKKLTKSPKYLIFDMGVRRVCARESAQLHPALCGQLFEQFVGLEIIKQIRQNRLPMRLLFWRDPDGPEVDWVIETDHAYIPIEVKWTDAPSLKDCKWLEVFLKEYPAASKGYVICRTPRAVQLSDKITALPWQELNTIFPRQSPAQVLRNKFIH